MNALPAVLELSERFTPGVPPHGPWQFTATESGKWSGPEQLAAEGFREAQVPSTVAAELRRNAQLGRDPGPALDASDYWYRTVIRRDEWPVLSDAGCVVPSSTGLRLLVFDGLATLCRVWVNGALVLDAQNMYRRYAVDISALLQSENEVVMCFRALTPVLKAKKGPRRWVTRLVSERNLRFVRTTLLGRMPGWTPPWPAVGPFRPVRLVTVAEVLLHEARCVPELHGDQGRVRLRVALSTTQPSCDANNTNYGGDTECATLASAGGRRQPTATLHILDREFNIALEQAVDGRFCADAVFDVGTVNPWWPHTHGEQPLYLAELSVRCGSTEERFQLGALGFRTVVLGPAEQFGFSLNGVDVFCRGACWTPLDVVSLSASEAQLREALSQVKAAGMNMLRLSGTLLYEQPLFHRLCDELGLLVWQDFMFANMDYPREDAGFEAEVTAEVSQLLERVGAHASTVLLCGGSETEQQAAMMGIAPEEWRHPVWRELLPRLVASLCPSVPYWYSSPGGAGMPFWPHDGCAHYYGVGAYLRPLADARLAGVRFASECLAFANPAAGTPAPVAGRPLGRVPQDNGASWDFGDVTEHYMQRLFGVNAVALRTEDPARYLELAAQAVARAMHSTQAHFRDPATPCRGSLIWLLRDLEPGSGWGIIDVSGTPKSGYHALSRVWAPRCAWFVDEGLSGLCVVVANDPGEELDAELTVSAVTKGREVERWSVSLRVTAHGTARVRVEDLAGRFLDSSYAYRFGAPAFEEFRLALTCGAQVIAEDVFLIETSAV